MRAQTWETVSNGAKRDEVEKWIANDIRACAEHAEKFGVIIGVLPGQMGVHIMRPAPGSGSRRAGPRRRAAPFNAIILPAH